MYIHISLHAHVAITPFWLNGNKLHNVFCKAALKGGFSKAMCSFWSVHRHAIGWLIYVQIWRYQTSSNEVNSFRMVRTNTTSHWGPWPSLLLIVSGTWRKKKSQWIKNLVKKKKDAADFLIVLTCANQCQIPTLLIQWIIFHLSVILLFSRI